MEFPTPVGMNRSRRWNFAFWVRVPHARGDEPASGELYGKRPLSSPRPWG